MSHTPGPWKYQRLLDAKGEPYATLYQAHIDLDVCMVWSPEGNKEQEANARLIAAAPDLLDALYECISWFEDNNVDCIALDEARAAINKARANE